MSGNKSYFLQYLTLFWPVRQSRAAIEPNLSLSQNTLINQVTFSKFWVYLVNKTHHPLLYTRVKLDRIGPQIQIKIDIIDFYFYLKVA